ncbi:MAG: prephenate dehydratase [Flavobacteriales bacterium]|nr:prephenate dehydratase [Bacteroidales bacterium AH-315-I05]PCJ88102.1 MAG: prephenate dehydratase [Flavobacteriales bacterium]
MSKPKIAIQGITTSFHDLAAKKHFGEGMETVPCLSFKELCEAVKTGRTDNAVMAIENTLAGSLLPNYNLISEYHLKIIGEVFVHIQMNLMALPDVKLEDIKCVQSHPIAIQQCAEFLWGLNGIEIREREDTAICAKEIKEKNLVDTAAIANEAAAKLYGLRILEKRIETYKQNFTRFLVLSRSSVQNEKNNKASLCLQLGHYEGSLAEMLIIFKENSINLTKIQSVPIMGKPYEYSFHVDLEWTDYNDYEKALQTVLKKASNVSVLGEYQKGEFSY